MNIIAALLVYYPLLLPIWENEPLSRENSRLPSAPSYMDEGALLQQKKYFIELEDPMIRSRVAGEMIKSNNPSAVAVLEGLLLTEKNPFVLADILKALDAMEFAAQCRKLSTLESFFVADNPSARAYSRRLYTASSTDVNPVLASLKGEGNLFATQASWGQLAKFAAKCSESGLKPFLTDADANHRFGAGRVLAIISANPDIDSGLASLLDDPEVLVRAGVAEGLSKRASGGDVLLGRLASDAHASVRAFVAGSPALGGRLKTHLKLSDDPDSEVRRLACLALSGYPASDVLPALLSRLSDPVESVRIAAEDSIIGLKPGAAVISQLGGEYLQVSGSRASAVRILGELGARDFAGAINLVLQEGGDHVLRVRAVRALGQLDYKDGWETVCGQSGHSRFEVRRAVAWALGRLARKEVFATLEQLESDKRSEVSVEALTSMGRIGNPAFAATLERNMRDVNDNIADERAAAIWAYSRLPGVPSAQVIAWYERLCLKAVIPVPGGPAEFDSEYVRASAVIALALAGRADPALQNRLERILKQFEDYPPSEGSTGISVSNPALKVYAGQVRDYLAGRASEPVLIPLAEPRLTIVPVGEK